MPLDNLTDSELKTTLNKPTENANWFDNLNKEDKYAKMYEEEALKVNPERAKQIVNAMEEYIKEAQRGVISYEQLEKYSKMLGLDKMTDKELRQAWSDIYNVGGYYGFGQTDFDRSNKLLDSQSAFAEVVNAEARKRKQSGNYFPYDEEDIEKAKGIILEMAKPHEGYDLDSAEAYLTQSEAKKIKEIANAFHLTDEDLANISPLFKGEFGYTDLGYKPPKK